MNEQYCNNCGKQGHLYHQCKIPITSIGLITFRYHNNEIQYLMICRKDTLGYIDFMRGKYSILNKDYVMNMLKQMTNEEKERLKTWSFEELWMGIWGTKSISSQYKSEESISYEKFTALRNGINNKNDYYDLTSMIEESNQYPIWEEPEWGFPKGRRNFQEKDFDCALREFNEETGYVIKNITTIQNIYPFEEIFTGSNYKSYKHKYYLAFMKDEHTAQMDRYERSEVSKMEWKSYSECITAIRPYNLEKLRMLSNIHHTLKSLRMFVS
jgi:8-oxo-dGTP pyrophosphatase MutT (NUDIX family)